MIMQSCIFCKIIKGEIPSAKVFEDEKCIAIRDIQPQAKTHLLVIPKKHVSSLGACLDEGMSSAELGDLMCAVSKIAKLEGIWPAGFRTVLNSGAPAGQTVFHMHVHVLGGENLRGGFA